MIVKPTKEAARAILDAAWQKQWDDNIASLSKIEWEVLAHAALPNRRFGAYDILDGMSRHQRFSRTTAISRLLVFGYLRNVHSKNFATISEDGLRALAERRERVELTKASKAS